MAGAVTILLTANNCLAQHPYPAQAGAKAVVAPIFEHGEGRGATGCVVVNPPVFLSEQDAMQVIREELPKSGVSLSEGSVLLARCSRFERSNRPELQTERSRILFDNVRITFEYLGCSAST